MEEKLTCLLEYKFDDNNPDVQEEYYKILDKVIDACIFLKYDDVRNSYDFSSLNQLDELIIYNFKKINDSNKEFIIKNLAFRLTRVSSHRKDTIYQNKIYDFLEKLYSLYITTNNTLSYEITTDFYNEILNRQQDKFVKVEKELIIKDLLPKLPLTNKKINTLKRNAKLKKINEILRSGNSSFIDYQFLEKELDLLHVYLNEIKPFCKNRNITLEQFKVLDNLFLNGNLTLENICSLNLGFDSDEVKVILNKYHKILFSYLDKIDISNNDLDYSTVNFNYNHVKVLNRDYYYKNIKKLFSSITLEEMGYIVNNFDYLEDVFKLIPFIDMFLEFSVEDFKFILLNYNQIINNMVSNGKISNNNSFNSILDNLYEVIKLARAYGSSNKYVTAILGEDIISSILSERQTSRNPSDYVDVYINMLKTSITTIPPISGEVNGYRYECGNNYDLNKLLIGKNCYKSCIGPNGVGNDAYYAALTSTDASVLVVTKDGEFAGRSVIFRKDNYLILAPIHGKKGLNKNLYNKEFLDKVSENFLTASEKTLDSLNYVFLTQDSLGLLSSYSIYEDQCFEKDFPHADLNRFVYLLNSVKSRKSSNTFDYKYLYNKKRKKVVCKSDDYSKDIYFIRALEISMEEDLERKKLLDSRFDILDNYEKVYLGQDFYIGLLSNGKIDRVILNTGDSRQNIEINRVVDDIVTFDSKYNNDLLINNSK